MSEPKGLAALKRAVEIIGSQEAAARIAKTKQQYISDRLVLGKKIPAEWCIPLDLATAEKGKRVSCHQLRPDLWPKNFRPSRQTAAA